MVSVNPPCTFKGCVNRSKTKRIAGLCGPHRDMERAGEGLRPLRRRLASRISADGIWCPGCGQWLDAEKFNKFSGSPTGVQSHCKLCHTRIVRTAQLKRKYNITFEDYERLLSEQGGVCAVCGTDAPRGAGSWHIDHDHSCCPGSGSCGKCIRGLLCTNCNTGLGHFKDDPKVLLAALEYIQKWSA